MKGSADIQDISYKDSDVAKGLEFEDLYILHHQSNKRFDNDKTSTLRSVDKLALVAILIVLSSQDNFQQIRISNKSLLPMCSPNMSNLI